MSIKISTEIDIVGDENYLKLELYTGTLIFSIVDSLGIPTEHSEIFKVDLEDFENALAILKRHSDEN